MTIAAPLVAKAGLVQGPQARESGTLPDAKSHFASHAKFDRLVVVLPPGSTFTSHQDQLTLLIAVTGVAGLDGADFVGRRLRSVTMAGGTLRLALAPGTRAKIWRLDQRLVIDVLDQATPVVTAISPSIAKPPATKPPQLGAVESRSPAPLRQIVSAAPTSVPELRRPAPSPHATPETLSARRGESIAAVSPAETSPQDRAPAQATAASAPIAQAASDVAVVPLAAGAGLEGPSVFVPLKAGTGAAVFSRNGIAQIVFDMPKPLDLGLLKDDANFGGMTERILAEGTLLTMKLPGTSRLLMHKRPDGWCIALAAANAAATMEPVIGRFKDGRLFLDAKAAGHVIVVDDEATGGRLLVGTQSMSGQGTISGRRMAELSVLPSWQGVVVQPNTDRLVMTVAPSGFVAAAPDGPPLSIVWPEQLTGAWPDGRTMTRLFDFLNLPAAVLHRRLGQALQDAAASPKLARYKPRIRVAEAMLAQGLDVEAEAAIEVAKSDDPTQGDDPVAGGLEAIATWMSANAGGSPPVQPLPAAEHLGNTDEAILWRALLHPQAAGDTSQGEALAAVWPMVLDYPPSLRSALLRPIAARLASSGQDKALAALLKAWPGPELDLFRSKQLETAGKTAESLALLEEISGRSDRITRAEALTRSVELRLAAKRIPPLEAADALEKQVYAWRGGDRELQLRRRVAQLRAQGGAWREGLAMLRETEVEFPAAHEQIHGDELAIVHDLLRDDHATRIGALDVVALADEASTLFKTPDLASGLAPILVEKLMALDLPDRAEPILRRLFEKAEGAAQAELGLRLAGLSRERGDMETALHTLDRSTDNGLPAALVTNRALLKAQLLASARRPADALAALAGQRGLPCIEVKASILEGERDFAGAAASLKPLLAEGSARAKEPSRRKLILRIARDESNAGDMAGLRELRRTEGSLFVNVPGSELFALLTAEPIATASDLPRAAGELMALRNLPAKLTPRPSL